MSAHKLEFLDTRKQFKICKKCKQIYAYNVNPGVTCNK